MMEELLHTEGIWRR